MSLNQLIDTSSTNNRKYLDVKVNSLNNIGALKFDNNAGTNDQIIRNVGGLPEWTSIGNVTPRCRVAQFSPNGKTLLGVDEGAQDIASESPLLNKFQNTLIANTSIINHPNDTDFEVMKSGIYMVTLVAPVYNNDCSIGFGINLNNDPNYINGWAATSPIDSSFIIGPGVFNAAGASVTLVRLLSVTSGTIIQIYSNAQVRRGPGSFNNYYVGQRSASLTIVYLGQNTTD